MKQALADLFSSKKFLTAVVGLVVAAAARYGWDVDTELVIAGLGLVAVLVGAQGAADHGKEAAKVHAGSMEAEPAPMPRPETVEGD